MTPCPTKGVTPTTLRLVRGFDRPSRLICNAEPSSAVPHCNPTSHCERVLGTDASATANMDNVAVGSNATHAAPQDRQLSRQGATASHHTRHLAVTVRVMPSVLAPTG